MDKKLRQAHQAVMLEDAQQLLQQNRAQNRAHARMVGENPAMPDEDPSMIHIGDYVQQAPAPSTGHRWAAPAMAGLGLLAGAGAAAVLLNKPAPVPPTVLAPVTQPVEFDKIEQQLQPDGSWKPTGVVTRIRTMPDGSVQTKQPDGTWK